MEHWIEIPGFPNYEISARAMIRSKEGRRLRVSSAANGSRKVSLYEHKTRMQHTRSVARLVAKAFVDLEPCAELYDVPFDTVTHIDGDYRNCHADNLVWRPRWFSIAYHKQLHRGPLPYYEINSVVDIFRGLEYDSIWDAVIDQVLLASSILESANSRFSNPVFPTKGMFQYRGEIGKEMDYIEPWD